MINSQQMISIGNYVYNPRYCLGQGAYGKVFEGFNLNKKKVAIKKMDLKMINSDQYLKHSIKSQIQILKKFNHTNIVKLFDIIFTINSIYIITQYCSGGDLKSYLKNKKLTQQESLKIFKQLISGIKQLVRQKIIHRDIKPANILIHQGSFKIADFGFAKYSNKFNNCKTVVGTPLYMSPQQLKQQQYSMKSDIWALGVLFYQMLFKSLPWSGRTQSQLLKNIKNKPLIISQNKVSSKTAQLLKGMLAKEQRQRFTWQKIFEITDNLKLSNFQNSKNNMVMSTNINSLFAFYQQKQQQQEIVQKQISSKNESLNESLNEKMKSNEMIKNKKNFCKDYKISNILDYLNSETQIDLNEQEFFSSKNKRLQRRAKNMLANTATVQIKTTENKPKLSIQYEMFSFIKIVLDHFSSVTMISMCQFILSGIKFKLFLNRKQFGDHQLIKQLLQNIKEFIKQFKLQVMDEKEFNKYKSEIIRQKLRDKAEQQFNCLIEQEIEKVQQGLNDYKNYRRWQRQPKQNVRNLLQKKLNALFN